MRLPPGGRKTEQADLEECVGFASWQLMGVNFTENTPVSVEARFR
jgi:hypothetical protein